MSEKDSRQTAEEYLKEYEKTNTTDKSQEEYEKAYEQIRKAEKKYHRMLHFINWVGYVLGMVIILLITTAIGHGIAHMIMCVNPWWMPLLCILIGSLIIATIIDINETLKIKKQENKNDKSSKK